MIHAQAFVSPDARLGKNVKVGPGAVIDAGCVIGDDCEIRAHAVITGETVMGAGNQIGYGAIIGAEPQDLSFKGVRSQVVIGDRNVIREYVTIHRGTKEGTQTIIGNECFLMAGAHVAHNCHLGNNVILVNNVLLAGHVQVQDRAFLGGSAVVHQNVRIGEMAIIRGNAGVGKDLPPYFMAVGVNQVSGLNKVGMKRAGIQEAARRQVRRAYEMLYSSGLNLTQAIEKIENELSSPEITKLVAFLRGTKRGICLALSREDSADEE